MPLSLKEGSRATCRRTDHPCSPVAHAPDPFGIPCRRPRDCSGMAVGKRKRRNLFARGGCSDSNPWACACVFAAGRAADQRGSIHPEPASERAEVTQGEKNQRDQRRENHDREERVPPVPEPRYIRMCLQHEMDYRPIRTKYFRPVHCLAKEAGRETRWPRIQVADSRAGDSRSRRRPSSGRRWR